MAFQQHALAAMIVLSPVRARKTIAAAFRKAHASRRRTATALGCSEVTLWRWVRRLEMVPALTALEEQAAREGWHHDIERRRRKVAS